MIISISSSGGHTDVLGDDRYNLALSQRRASAAAAALIRLGVSDVRIDRVAHGVRHPRYGDHSEDGGEAGHRVEIYVIERE